MPKTPKTPSGSDARGGVPALERSPSHLLHRALQLALDVYGDEAGSDAVTQRQFAVLAAVQAHDQPTQTDLVRSTGIDRSTLADMIARMTTKGVLARERSTLDARANIVRLTDAGLHALESAAPKAAAADLRILSALGAGKRDAFVAALRTLAKAGEGALLGVEVQAIELEAKPAKARKTKVDRPDKPSKKQRRKAKKSKATKGAASGAPPAAEPEPAPPG